MPEKTVQGYRIGLNRPTEWHGRRGKTPPHRVGHPRVQPKVAGDPDRPDHYAIGAGGDLRYLSRYLTYLSTHLTCPATSAGNPSAL